MEPTQHLWPWPRLIAHRGGGALAPENTLAAFRTGRIHGFSMMEYDVKLSKDGIPVLLHDDDINRTSDGQGTAASLTLNELLQRDFGAWHSSEYAGEPIALLGTIARFTIAHAVHSNIEIKPSPGVEWQTGEQVATTAQRLWVDASLPPLLSSFSEVALEAAYAAAPKLPRALLIEGPVPADWPRRVQRLGCIGLNVDHQHLTRSLAREILTAGYSLAVWTVNDMGRARELFDWGCHAIVTDNLAAINPASFPDRAP